MSTQQQTALDWYASITCPVIKAQLEKIKHVETIGDIRIYADDHLVYIRVDDKTVLNVPRAGHGLDRFVEVLQTLVQ